MFSQNITSPTEIASHLSLPIHMELSDDKSTILSNVLNKLSSLSDPLKQSTGNNLTSYVNNIVPIQEVSNNLITNTIQAGQNTSILSAQNAIISNITPINNLITTEEENSQNITNNSIFGKLSSFFDMSSDNGTNVIISSESCSCSTNWGLIIGIFILAVLITLLCVWLYHVLNKPKKSISIQPQNIVSNGTIKIT